MKRVNRKTLEKRLQIGVNMSNLDIKKEIEIAKLWGFIESDLREDEACIYRFEFKREEIIFPNITTNKSIGNIHLAQANNNKWAVNSSISLHHCGSGSMPSIYNKTQYTDKQEAINAEINNIILYCKKSGDKLAEKAVSIMEKFKDKQNSLEHPNLF